MRTTAVALGAAALLALASLAPGTAASAAPLASAAPAASANPAESPNRQLARQLGFQLVPKDTPSARKGGPAEANPFLALTPDPSQINVAGWKAKIAAASAHRATTAKAKTAEAAKAAEAGQATSARPAAVPEPLLVDEQEPDALLGGNDSTATAQRIPAFGSASGKRPAARVLGTLAPPASGGSTGPNAEDDGSITLAGDPGVVSKSQRRVVNAVIGDGPHGSAGDGSGDFDFYAVRGVSAGQTLNVAVDSPASELDSVLVVYDAAGQILATNDDGPLSVDSALTLTAPADGDYFVMVTGYLALPADPFDSGSGDGAQVEGAYDVTIGLDAADVDYYAVNLRAGDVLSGSVSGAAGRLSVISPSGTEVFGSTLDASSLYPAATPLAGGGNAVVDHVAATSGWHYVRVGQGVGAYDVTLEVYRHAAPGTQTIFLDFDGARVNTAIFGGPGVRQLSPLAAFTGRWGISASQQNALINRVVATVTENLRQDFTGTGVKIKVLNSRDHADPWGQSNVSRLIIGGTIDESGVDTIGIAQSIDPGNFETEETALVLLDDISGPAGTFGDASFNTYLTPQSDRVAFVGTALGNIASHEAGHILGSWHVDQRNTTLNLMDQGGNVPLLYGVGPDGAGGTADDPDVDFGPDILAPIEGFTGIENTKARTRWALTPA